MNTDEQTTSIEMPRAPQTNRGFHPVKHDGESANHITVFCETKSSALDACQLIAGHWLPEEVREDGVLMGRSARMIEIEQAPNICFGGQNGDLIKHVEGIAPSDVQARILVRNDSEEAADGLLLFFAPEAA